MSQLSRALLLASLCAAPLAQAALTVNADTTVTDTTTGLVWDQCAYGLTGATCASGTAFYGTWAEALMQASAANTVAYKGFTDWRVPNKNELESLVKIDASLPAIDAATFPNTPTSDYFWTSTTYAPDPAVAWVVNFNDGNTNADLKGYVSFVRLVRSGQSFSSFDSLLPVVNGSCGSAHATTPLMTSAPSTNLCSVGTAGSVTSGTSAFTWSCTGSGGGSTASCSASRGYTVTPSAGSNGSISPSTSQVVAYNATPGFTATPAANYAVNTWAGTCGGTPSGTGNVNYTTSAVTTDCTVSVSFSGTDSTPDAFSFTAANGVALSTQQTSNTITVAGINTGAAISITGGEYQIGSGAFTSAAGTVNNGDTVTVRHTSSAAFSTATTTTLTIGGVSANYVSTTVAPTVINGACGSSANVATAFLPTANLCSAGTASTVTPGTSSWAWSCTGTGPGATSATCSAPYAAVNGGGGTVGAIQTPGTNGWQIDQTASGFVALPAPAPVGIMFPGGATKVVLNTGTAGTSATVTLRFSSIPAGAQLYKYGKENGIGDTHKWFAYPATIDFAGGTVTYTLTDGQRGDNDWTANSVIDDPVGLGVGTVVTGGVTSVPTLSQWAMMLLAALMALATFLSLRRRSA